MVAVLHSFSVFSIQVKLTDWYIMLTEVTSNSVNLSCSYLHSNRLCIICLNRSPLHDHMFHSNNDILKNNSNHKCSLDKLKHKSNHKLYTATIVRTTDKYTQLDMLKY